jgi:hypothetical protein
VKGGAVSIILWVGFGRITRNDGFRPAIIRLHHEYGDSVIDRTCTVHTVDNTLISLLPSIQCKPGLAAAKLKRRWLKILHCFADQLDQIGFEFLGLSLDLAHFLGRESIHIEEVFAHDWTAMRMRGGQHHLRPFNTKLLLHGGGDINRQVARDPNQVGGDENQSLAGGILEAHRFRMKIVDCSLGWLGTSGVTGHPHRLLRSNDP